MMAMTASDRDDRVLLVRARELVVGAGMAHAD